MAVAVEAALGGVPVLWGAPTYDQVRVAWDESRRAAGTVAVFNSSLMTAAFPGGGRIVYRSLDDPDNARGHTAGGVIIDESGDVLERAWYEVLRPMLVDSNGWAWCVGTPKGRNWFWREHEAARGRPDSAAWQAPTLGVEVTPTGLVRRPHPLENPHVPFAELDTLWRTLPERTFVQELLAAFIESAGGVFRGVRAAATATPQDAAVRGHEYAFGVDWGKQHDWTVIAVLDVTTAALVAMERFNRIDYALQVGRLQALAERFGPLTIIAERNSMGEPLIEQIGRLDLPIVPFTTTNATKAVAIDALALALERRDLTLIPDSVLLGELEAYEMQRLPSGLFRYSAPAGMHDDTVMALALAWQAVGHEAGGYIAAAPSGTDWARPVDW